MTTWHAPTAQAPYLGATAAELSSSGASGGIAAGVSQRALLRRRGEIALYPARLVLRDWSDDGDLVLTRADIGSVRTEFKAWLADQEPAQRR